MVLQNLCLRRRSAWDHTVQSPYVATQSSYTVHRLHLMSPFPNACGPHAGTPRRWLHLQPCCRAPGKQKASFKPRRQAVVASPPSTLLPPPRHTLAPGACLLRVGLRGFSTSWCRWSCHALATSLCCLCASSQVPTSSLASLAGLACDP